LTVEKVLLLATRNTGKLRELNEILARHNIRAIDLESAGIPPDAREDGIEVFETFADNAAAKARYFHELTRLPTLADDSGLCVDHLGGAPGVRSRRFSGRSDLSGQDLDDANNRKLISELAGIPRPTARYRCAAAYAGTDGDLVAEGEAAGEIIQAPRGGGGFGYDPYFLSTNLGLTFAQATAEEKARVSHRGRAFRALISMLRERGRI